MKASTAAALLAIVASALFCTISAKNVACINGNSKIQRLFCDGVDYTSQLVNRENPNQCDCIEMPVCKVVSIKAKGVKNLQQVSPGVQFCQTTKSAVYSDWMCTPGTRVGGRGWTRNRFSRRKNWKSSAKPQGSCQTCHNVKHLPCHSSCFWHEKNWVKDVNCVRTQCADQCTDCSKTGAGNCDPGKSMFNTTMDPTTGADVLNHQCRIDWKTWNGASGKGYIKVTDESSGSVSILPANEAGLYMAAINTSTCEFSFTNFTTLTADGYNALLGTGINGGPSTLNALVGSFDPYSSGQYKNTYAAVLGAGTVSLASGGVASYYAPSIGAVLLGTNSKTYVVGDLGTHSDLLTKYCSASMLITGIQNVNPTVTPTDPSSTTASYTSTTPSFTATYNYGNPC